MQKSNKTTFRAIFPEIFLAILAGLIFAVSHVGLGQSDLAWFSFLPILWALDRARLKKRHALFLGWTFGLTLQLIGFYWVAHVIQNFGDLPLSVALLGCLLFCLYQGFQWAIWALGIFWLKQNKNLPFVWSAPILGVAIEWIYPSIFPYYVSNSQFRNLTFIQSLDLWGPLGLSFLVILLSSLVYALFSFCFKKKPFPSYALSVGLSLFIFNQSYGIYKKNKIESEIKNSLNTKHVGIAQAEVHLNGLPPKIRPVLKQLREQSLKLQANNVDLIIWSESTSIAPFSMQKTNLKQEVLGEELHTPLIFGGLRVVSPKEYYNTAYVLKSNGDIAGFSDKHKLLAFGEYIPLGDYFPWLYNLSPNIAHFSHGEKNDPIELNNVNYGILICYEDILPGFVNELMEKNPEVLVNLTNDSWYGDSTEPISHLALASFRAVEHRRYLLRSTLSGISAVISPTGKIIASTPTFEAATLRASFVPMQEKTFYSQWGNFIGPLAWMALLLFFFMPASFKRIKHH